MINLKHIRRVIRNIIKRYFPKYQITLVVDDRENLSIRLNYQRPQLGEKLNQQNANFSKWISSHYTGTTQHYIYGETKKLLALGLSHYDLDKVIDCKEPGKKAGKNWADIALAAHLFDELLSVRVTQVVLISADGDFSSIPIFLRQHGIVSILLSPVDNAKALQQGFCKELSITPFLLQLDKSLIPKKVKSDTDIKDIVIFILSKYLGDNKRINLAEAGKILICYLNTNDDNWFGYGSLKNVCKALAPDFRIEGDYLVMTTAKNKLKVV
jgi:uncharacterized LabA/DUF88 family protein